MTALLQRTAVLRMATDPAERPDRLPRALWAMRSYGPGMLGAIAAACARYPHRDALITPSGRLTFAELWHQSGTLANALTAAGITTTDRVGLLARNDRLFVVTLVATARAGVDVVLLNTAHAGPQLAEVVDAEQVRLLIHDTELSDAAAHCTDIARWDTAEADRRGSVASPRIRPPARAGEMIVLTSGTTGRPRGARRPTAGRTTSRGAQEFAAALPWRLAGTACVPAPFFHAWGLSGLMIALSLSNTVLTRESFDPADTLTDIATHRATMLIVVPVMLQRMVALDGAAWARNDLSCLRGIVSSGSALPASVARDVLRRCGPVLYNVYGSTEVAACTIARPADLRRNPSTAGRPAPGVRVAVLDADRRRLGPGESGQVYVGSAMTFRGYTGGDDRTGVDGLIPTGDLGHWDSSGCLVIDGRTDDMIVSGGENVYPIEVEDLLTTHPDVVEVAVAGRPDDEFGQALVAWVVLRPDAAATGDSLREFVAAHLARFKVPRRVVLLDELPRNATGKILRRKLT